MVVFRFNFATFAASNKKSLIMKKTFITLLLMTAFIAAEAQQVMRKEKDGTYIVNTTTIANDVEGYAGPTPVEVYIKKNKIVKVVMLKSQETPKYYVLYSVDYTAGEGPIFEEADLCTDYLVDSARYGAALMILSLIFGVASFV